MSKFFALLVVLSSIIFSAESALAGDWRGGGGHHGWSYPHSGYGGHYSNHHGHRGGKNDFLYGVLAGTMAGVILSQPPIYSQSPPTYYPSPPRRCWEEWRPAYGLYDRHGRQLGQNITVCERW